MITELGRRSSKFDEGSHFVGMWGRCGIGAQATSETASSDSENIQDFMEAR
jgi:hypothetical protein